MANTIARERVDNLASRNSEPTWLKELRLSAWETYLQTAMPTARDEEWRRIEIEALDLSNLKTADLRCTSDEKNVDEQHIGEKHIKGTQIARIDQKNIDLLPEYFRGAIKTFETAAAVVAETCDYSLRAVLKPEFESKGVVFCSLKSAIEKHHELVRPFLEKKSFAEGKFTLMNKALFNGGTFLYIPANVQVDGLLLSLVHLNNKQAETGVAVFPRTIIVLGANSSGSIVSSISSDETSDERPISLSNASVEIHLAAGAQLTYVEMHKFGKSTFAVARNHYEIERDARLYSLTVGLGGGQIKSDITTDLVAPGASIDVEGVVLGDDSEHFSFNTSVDHDAPDTTSNINFRVALKDRASSAYMGTIRVAKVAQRTNSYQSNKNLLLGADAKADSIPKLEILADDVKCSHGATVGPVDQEQIFYLMSRGLTRSEAEELIVTGFFRKIVDSCAVPGAIEYIGDLVAEKIHSQKPH